MSSPTSRSGGFFCSDKTRFGSSDCETQCLHCQAADLPPMPSELLLLAKDPLMGPALVEWGRRLIASRSENRAHMRDDAELRALLTDVELNLRGSRLGDRVQDMLEKINAARR